MVFSSVLQILPIFWCLSPYYGSGLGLYEWSFTDGGCAPFILEGNLPVTAAYIVYAFIIFSVILITTLWTFAFTHKFLRKRFQILQEVNNSDVEKHVYLQKVRNLIGVFGALLIANSFSWIPYFISIFYTLIGVSVDKVPVEIDATLFLLTLSNNVTNPIIQIYFRRDLSESLNRMFQMLKRKSVCSSGRRCLWKGTKDKNFQEEICEDGVSAISENCRLEVQNQVLVEYEESQGDNYNERGSFDHSSSVTPSSVDSQTNLSVCYLNCDITKM